MLLAPGADGDFAHVDQLRRNVEGDRNPDLQELSDVSFATARLGYALDASGGLQMTSNGGGELADAEPGNRDARQGVLAVGEHTVLLIGPVGISRAVGGGAFAPLGGAVAKAHLSDYDAARRCSPSARARTR